MNAIIKIDKKLFELLNEKWHSDWLDTAMPIVRNAQTWIPLYLFLLLFVALNYKKNSWWWIIFAAAVPAISDFISSDLIKNNIHRLRPCNDPSMVDQVRFLLSYRPQSSSFTSSHATNHFAMAAYFFFTLRKKINSMAYLFFFWATIICYAQIYVGVHFPLDILCGAFLGFFI